MRANAASTPRRTRRHVDDPAPALRPHVRQNGLGAEERRFEDHGDGGVEFLLRQVVDAADDGDAGVLTNPQSLPPTDGAARDFV